MPKRIAFGFRGVAAALLVAALFAGPLPAAAASADLGAGGAPPPSSQAAEDWRGAESGATSVATGQTVVTRGTTAYSSAWALPDSGGTRRVVKPWEVTGTAPDAGLGMANADGTWYVQGLPTQGPAPAQPEPVNWPSQPDRSYGASARVSYRTVKSEFAGPEGLVDTRTRTWTEYADRREQPRTETLDLGTRADGPRREGPYLVTDVYRTTGTRTVTTYTWRERQATEIAKVYGTPYYYHVTVYRDVTVPGHYEKRPVQETRYWTRTVRETVQVPVTRMVTVPETRYREVQETRYWTRTVRETVQIPVTKTRQEPVYETVMVPYTYTYTEWVQERVPQYKLVTETRYRTVKKWYSFPWGGGFWHYEREPYTVTRYELVGYTTRLVPVTRTKTVMYPERRLVGYRTVTWTEYQTVVRERAIHEPYTVTVVKPYTVYVTKTVTEYRTVTRERLVREPYTVTVEKDVWVPEKSWTEVASRYDTSAPHRYSYRADTSVAYSSWEEKRLVEYGPLRVTTASERQVQRADWKLAQAAAPEGSGGSPQPPTEVTYAEGTEQAAPEGSGGSPQPPRVRPVITVVGATDYLWSNYSQYQAERKAQLVELEGDFWKQVSSASWLSEEEIARMYGYELVKVPAHSEAGR